jgi:hypothetical protein
LRAVGRFLRQPYYRWVCFHAIVQLEKTKQDGEFPLRKITISPGTLLYPRTYQLKKQDSSTMNANTKKRQKSISPSIGSGENLSDALDEVIPHPYCEDPKNPPG